MYISDVRIENYRTFQDVTFHFDSRANYIVGDNNIGKSNFLSFLIAICIFCVSLWPKNYAISTYYSNIVYKYSFFTLVIGISFIVLLFATIKKAIRRWLSRAKTH